MFACPYKARSAPLLYPRAELLGSLVAVIREDLNCCFALQHGPAPVAARGHSLPASNPVDGSCNLTISGTTSAFFVVHPVADQQELDDEGTGGK